MDCDTFRERASATGSFLVSLFQIPAASRMSEAQAPKNKGMERVKGLDLYLLLEVDLEADSKTIKKAYRCLTQALLECAIVFMYTCVLC